MIIRYLHIGQATDKESGVTRYGRRLGAAARLHPDMNVTEQDVVLSNDVRLNESALRQVAGRFSAVDVVHLQFNKYTWGTGRAQLSNLKAFVEACAVPIVASLHDIYYETYPHRSAWKTLKWENYKRRRGTQFRSLELRSTLDHFWRQHIPDNRTMGWLLKNVKRALVCTVEEKRRLMHFPRGDRLQIIPHFVETRSPALTPAQAKAKLGLTGKTIVTLQGFIYETKGHSIALEALAELPDNIQLVFAGGCAPSMEYFIQRLTNRAAELRLHDRLLITGYLSEPDLETYLVASDLAISPFEDLSASGSLCTWISLGKPIVASDVPQVAELNDWEPNAIMTFKPYAPAALAAAIRAALQLLPVGHSPGIARLRDRLALEQIAKLHVDCYQAVLGAA